VTFCQIGDDYSDAEFGGLVEKFTGSSSDGIVSAGKFGGTSEISLLAALGKRERRQWRQR
jgi:hypothetical protein